MNLNPVTYNYKDENQKGILYTGLIAQEVDAAAKKEGVDFSGVDKNGEYWGIRYGELTVPLIKSVQELNEKLEMKNEQLETKVSSLEKKIEQMQQCLNVLCEKNDRTNNAINENSLQIQIAPNPTNGLARITISGNEQLQNLTIKIIDFAGKTIRSFNASSNSTIFELDTQSLSKGSYAIQLLNQDELIKSEKLIVQ